MTYQSLAKAAGLFLLATTILVSGGCGYKTPPVPPQTIVPEPINDLVYTVGDNGVELSWTYPIETIKGDPIENVAGFELYRAEIPLDDYCGSCPIPFAEPLNVEAGAPIDGTKRRKATFTADMLLAGYKYFFKVRSRTSWWAESADSNIVTFTWSKPAAAAKGLTVVPKDREVRLSWQPVTTHTDGTALENPVRYQVLRSTGGGELERVGDPLEKTSYLDRQVLNGKKYFYAVQTIMMLQEEKVEGAVSGKIAAVPVDLTPPVAPAGVTAVRTDVGIKIFWDKNTDEDIAGYRVYRRAASEDTYTLLGEVAPEYVIYVDSSAGESVRYYYAVTAFDSSNPPNESIKSREATIRY